jgi:hypothetical protein
MLNEQRNGQLRKQYRNTNKQKRNSRQETVTLSSFNCQIRVKMIKFVNYEEYNFTPDKAVQRTEFAISNIK